MEKKPRVQEKFKIYDDVSTLYTARDSGSSMKIRFMSWGGRSPVYDLRWWSPDDMPESGGIALTVADVRNLARSLLDHEQKQEAYEKEFSDGR